MMFDKDTQYVNMIINQQNLKLDYKILHNNSVSKNDQSIFLLENNNISNDAKLKLASLQNNISKTYVSAICEDDNQKIVSTNEAITSEYKSVSFDRKNNIILKKSNLEKNINYFNNDIDYFISAFSILQEVLNSNLDEKSLNMFIFNDKIYSIILNKEKRLTFSNITKLTPYDEVIKDESFFEDEISKQKLYDEMYLLELQTHIESITGEFYETNSNSFFIEKVNIFYSIKQLKDEQIQNLKNNIMIEVNYSSIEIDEILFKLVEKQNIKHISFTNLRKKKSNNSLFMLLIALILATLIIVAGIFYYKKFIYKEDINQKIVKKENIIKQKNVIKEIALPKHKELNIQKTNLLISLFDSIGSQEVLKEIQVEDDESTLICNLKEQDSYEKELKPKLLNIYKQSENILSTQNKKTLLYTAIISNTKLIKKDMTKRIKLYKPNKKYKILDEKESTIYLEKLTKNSLVLLDDTKTKKYTKFIFNIESKVTNPLEFFDIIKSINKQYYSITLTYPIEFTKLKDTISVKYNLIFNQIKKENKALK